jgi:hypothetical protein
VGRVVFQRMMGRDSAAAREWLQKLPGADPRWKNWLLRSRG